VLFVGDACHTRFGWQHGVEPGTFSTDRAESRISLDALEALAARHPTLDVRLGHQGHDEERVVRGRTATNAARPHPSARIPTSSERLRNGR
jgi:glyoxylase-like metal-dependent hydrolase (beta-lactamase superfamily II)